MELILLTRDGDYVGSVHFKGREVLPDVVVFAQEAYVYEAPHGERAGGVPRYVKAKTFCTTMLTTTEQGRPFLRKTKRR